MSPSRSLEKQRWAVTRVFFVAGLFTASWVPHIPYVKAKHGLSEGTLGLVLLAMGLGAVLAMLTAGTVSARLGPEVLARWATLSLSLAVPLPVVAPNVWVLVTVLVFYGASLGVMDIAMNAVAADIEIRFGRPIMSSVHGLFSAGALVGALVAVALLSADVSPPTQTALIAVIAFITVWPSLRILPASLAPPAVNRPHLSLPTGRLLTIGILAFALFVAEGSAYDWSATLLRDDLGTSSAVAAMGFGAFSTTMATGRLFGDRINARFGPRLLLRGGSALAAVGLGGGLLIGEPWSVVLGFAILGAGLSNSVPLLFTAAAAAGSTPADGIASVAALGYVGLLLGPPVIGAVAEFTNLSTGLALVVCLVVIVSTQSRLVESRNSN